MEYKDVFISKVACAAFTLGKEGKVKIFAPTTSRATGSGDEISSDMEQKSIEQLLDQLIATARIYIGFMENGT